MRMTEKRFYSAESNLIDGYCVFDREKKYAFHPRPRKADCLNDVHILNELHEEKEDWKNNCLKTVSENSILWNEISILREQGAEPSNAFKNYLNNLKNKNKKLQGDLND